MTISRRVIDAEKAHVPANAPKDFLLEAHIDAGGMWTFPTRESYGHADRCGLLPVDLSGTVERRL